MITNPQADILAHTNNAGRYVSDLDDTLQSLISCGFLKDCGPQKLAGGMHYMEITMSGLFALYEWRDTQPKPKELPKRKQRARERYRRFLSCADATGCSFRAFLTDPVFAYARE